MQAAIPMAWRALICGLLLLSIEGLRLRDIQNIVGSSAGGLFKTARKIAVTAPMVTSSLMPFRFPAKVSDGYGAVVQEKRLPSNSRSTKAPAQERGFQFVRNAVRHVGPSVVRIDCEREISPMMSIFSDTLREGDVVKVSGTGIIASTDGYILTNAHVVDQAKKVTITLSNGRSFKATVVASDEFTDLAVIKADVTGETSFRYTAYDI
jgi:S1-C subfamily serine protease